MSSPGGGSGNAAPPAVEITERGIRTGDEEQLLISGEVHPWRIDPSNWERVLDAMADTGAGFVSTYVPWSVHEVERGRFDFTGRRDIVRFLNLASERGLKALVRPGPDCASELPDSGWPRRILEDTRCQALRPDRQPYLLVTATSHLFAPSYASRFFLDEVEVWYRGLCDVVAPLQWPAGPVVASQVDNEIGYHFQPNTFALDYHPDAVAAYREFLRRSYGDVIELNELYGTGYSGFGEIEPPTDGADEPEVWRLDWVRWREVHLREALTTLAGMLREAGMDRVPLIHNDYPRMNTPLDPAAIERDTGIQLAAGDIYTTKEGGAWLREFVRYVAGTSKLPVLLELGAGWLTLPWLFPARVTVSDEEIVSLRALLGGIRGVNVYMMVERDRWYGSPISVTGERRVEAMQMFTKLFDLLKTSGLSDMKRHAPVLLLENRDESRRAGARETLGSFSPSATALFPADRRLFESPDPRTEVLREWETALSRVLNEQGVDYDRAVSSSAAGLGSYEIVVMPVFESIDPEVWRKLLDASRSGTRVVVGPNIPRLDERLRPHDFDSAGIEIIEAAERLTEHLPTPPFRRSSLAIDLHLWSGTGGRQILGAFNSSGETVKTTIEFEGRARFRGLWQDETLEANGTAEVEIEPWGGHVWRVER